MSLVTQFSICLFLRLRYWHVSHDDELFKKKSIGASLGRDLKGMTTYRPVDRQARAQKTCVENHRFRGQSRAPSLTFVEVSACILKHRSKVDAPGRNIIRYAFFFIITALAYHVYAIQLIKRSSFSSGCFSSSNKW